LFLLELDAFDLQRWADRRLFRRILRPYASLLSTGRLGTRLKKNRYAVPKNQPCSQKISLGNAVILTWNSPSLQPFLFVYALSLLRKHPPSVEGGWALLYISFAVQTKKGNRVVDIRTIKAAGKHAPTLAEKGECRLSSLPAALGRRKVS